MDDLNILHVYKKEVTRIIKWMKRVYDEDVRVSRVNKHNYLYMDLELFIPGEARVNMVD